MYIHQASPSSSSSEQEAVDRFKDEYDHDSSSAAEDGISKGKVSLENSNWSEGSSPDGSKSNRSKKANLKRKDKKRNTSAIAGEDEEDSSKRTRSKLKTPAKPAPTPAKAAVVTANF